MLYLSIIPRSSTVLDYTTALKRSSQVGLSSRLWTCRGVLAPFTSVPSISLPDYQPKVWISALGDVCPGARTMPSARRLLSSIKSDSCEAAGCASLPDTPLWLCINCSSLYCDLCWDTQGPHKRGKVGEDGRPHERTEKEVYARLRPIFHPPENESALQKLHQDDEEALWFGVETEENKCVLTDSGRYAALMAATKQPTGSDRYPLLISFIGQTGMCSEVAPQISRLTRSRSR